MFIWEKIVKEEPTFHGNWEPRRAKVQSLDMIGAMDRQKSNVPTEIFSQGLEKPLSREQENPL